MSAERTSGRLLRLYPPAWRARYGEELEALILETSGDRVRWRVRADVALSAARERLHSLGLSGDRQPAERMRNGVTVVLCAWALFVVAGVAVQKLSEHWQAGVATGSRALPTAAFDVLVTAACIGSALVLAGAGVALPRVARLLRAGGWRDVRRPVLTAVAVTLAAVPAFAGLVVWAHSLGAPQRNGHDAPYSAAAAATGLLLVGCIAAWTAAAVSILRRLQLSRRVVRAEACLAVGVALAMATMTVATAVWSAALRSSVDARLLAVTVVMTLATAAAIAGARSAGGGLVADRRTEQEERHGVAN